MNSPESPTVPTRTLSALAALYLLAPTALAQTAADVSRVTILPGWELENGNRMIGVRVELAPGWKTYWRVPGSAGIPPTFDFSGSQNVAATRTYWPRPTVFVSNGTRTIGYKDQVIFPVELYRGGDGDMAVDLSLFYGVCEEICIPAEARIQSDLDAGHAGSESIRDAMSQQPESGNRAGVESLTCQISPDGDGYDLTARMDYSSLPGKDALAVFESGSDEVWISTSHMEWGDQSLRIDAALDHYGDGALALDRGDIRLTLLGDGWAVEVQGCPGS